MSSRSGRKSLALLVALLLSPGLLPAFETDLSSEAVRDAYFLGQRRDQKLAAFLASYEHHFPLPKRGPYISEIEFLTPYAQIIEASRDTVDYSAQQATLDYQERGDTIKIGVRIEFTATYSVIETLPAGSEGPTSTRLRSRDFWKDFRFGLSQDGRWVDPREVCSEPIYSPDALASGNLSGALVWLVYSAKDIRSEQALVEVVTPDGSQKVDTTFDLGNLR